MTDTQLATLLASRICHDLISPVGAINNGLELFEMMGGGTGGEEIDLIRMSADAATANLKFMRTAFGAADTGGKIPMAEIQAATKGFLGQKYKLIWNAGDYPRTRATTQLLSLVIMVTIDTAPLGGQITVVDCGEDPLNISITAEGRDLRARNADIPKTPRAAHALLLSALLMERGLNLRDDFESDRINLLIS
ncbi:MAG: histidine phosphotransferase family protein [Pikeienuella sp.]